MALTDCLSLLFRDEQPQPFQGSTPLQVIPYAQSPARVSLLFTPNHGQAENILCSVQGMRTFYVVLQWTVLRTFTVLYKNILCVAHMDNL